MFGDIYKNKRVLVTGHKGFKGTWLTHWLKRMGADVRGFDLVDGNDIKDAVAVHLAVQNSEPDFVFHLAAQPIVRTSYTDPVGTLTTNIIGTVNLLEALRMHGKRCSVVIVTSDKCYENKEWAHSYRETDALGGHDPYSASKACAELVVASYRKSFLDDLGIYVATARAGNVIGGGDNSPHRIVPDCIRSLREGKIIEVRSPNSVRCWLHVLDVLSGYLLLGYGLNSTQKQYRQAFNFSGGIESTRTVAELVKEIVQHSRGNWASNPFAKGPHEAGTLALAPDLAYRVLGWKPKLDFATTARLTYEGYFTLGDTPELMMDVQISEYESLA